MKLNFRGKETIDVAPQTLWDALIDPEILQKVVPGCREMRAVGETEYIMAVDLKVAAIEAGAKLRCLICTHQLVARSLSLAREHWVPALVPPEW